MIKLLLRSLNGDFVINYESPKTTSINEFKTYLYEQCLFNKFNGIEVPRPEQQNLVYKGHSLDFGTIEAAGVKTGDSIVILDISSPLDNINTQNEENAPTKEEIEKTIREYAKLNNIDIVLKSNRRNMMREGEGEEQEQEQEEEEGISERQTGVERGVSIGNNMRPLLTTYEQSLINNIVSSQENINQEQSQLNIPEPNTDYMRNLTEMGFSDNLARRALLLYRNSLEDALNWILANINNPDINEPIIQNQLNALYGLSNNRERYQEYLRQLVAMGFTENQAANALRINNNSLQRSLNHLVQSQRLEDVMEGLNSVSNGNDNTDNTVVNNLFDVFNNPLHDINQENTTTTEQQLFEDIDLENHIVYGTSTIDLVDFEQMIGSSNERVLVESMNDFISTDRTGFQTLLDTGISTERLRERFYQVMRDMSENTEDPGPSGEF